LLGFSNGYLLSSQFKLEFSEAVKSWSVMESFSSGNKLESLLESSRQKKAKNMGMSYTDFLAKYFPKKVSKSDKSSKKDKKSRKAKKEDDDDLLS